MKHNSIQAQLGWGRAFLAAHGIDSPLLDARVLLKAATGNSQTYLLTNGDVLLTPAQEALYRQYMNKRAVHMPVAYITQECEFMSLTFKVNEHVLIPRPDTETLVEWAINHIQSHNATHVLELGVGSGCIAVSVAHYCPEVHVTGVDISQAALQVAAQNATLHHVGSRINWVKSNMFNQLPRPVEPYDLLLSNPPYIAADELSGLDPNVADYEPMAALSGGIDGLYFYRAIAQGCAGYLKPGGWLGLEIGYNQGEAVCHILEHNQFESINIKKDLAGHSRVVTARYTPIDI